MPTASASGAPAEIDRHFSNNAPLTPERTRSTRLVVGHLDVFEDGVDLPRLAVGRVDPDLVLPA